MAPKTAEQSSTTAAGSTDEKGNNIWTLLPSFDPSEDDIREYTDKVRFLEAICPTKDKGMLAPRLAMLCKGTAWGQVKALSPADLTNPTTGVKSLLQALSSWEEAAELKTFEQFEKAIYKVVQRNDEATNSFVNRLEVAFHEIGEETTLKQVKAFIMLRQSALSPEDKRKIISMVNGDFETKKVEQAMRSLATRVLTSNSQEPKKKIYPVNYVEPEASPEQSDPHSSSTSMANWTMVATEEEDLDIEVVDSLAASGDSDALVVQGFERDLEEMFQGVPDLHTAMTSYVEARSKLIEKRKHRGFWPIRGNQKGGKSFGKNYRKGQSGKSNLLQRISRSTCRLCGERGHWKAECPQAQTMAKESANVAQQLNAFSTLEEFPWDNFDDFENAHVIVEDIAPPGIMESLRLLLIVLMNSFELTNPNQEIPLEHVQQMNQLLTEVQGQRQRIEELTHLIQAAPVLSPSNRASQRGVPSPQPSISLDSEEEWDPVDLAETIARTPAPTQRVTTQVRGSQNQTFLPTSLNTGTRVGTQRASSTVVTATPTPTDGETGGPRSSTSIHNQETQLAIARTTLEQWGQKRVSWGKKHAGAKFTDVFEEDPGYLVWLRARAKTHTVQMTDFIAYCETRINMEQRALQRSRQ
eukprot:symbB.v1.2.007827.t1/scaffold463.1/size291460/8